MFYLSGCLTHKTCLSRRQRGAILDIFAFDCYMQIDQIGCCGLSTLYDFKMKDNHRLTQHSIWKCTKHSQVLKVQRLVPAGRLPLLCALTTLIALLPSALCTLRRQAGPGGCLSLTSWVCYCSSQFRRASWPRFP